MLSNSNPRSIYPACHEDVDPLVGHMISRSGSNAKVRHDMWVKIWTNFGDDVYAWTMSLLDSSDTVSGVQHLENKDLLYMIVAGSLHRLLCRVHGEAL